jgi:hypothetical protein
MARSANDGPKLSLLRVNGLSRGVEREREAAG